MRNGVTPTGLVGLYLLGGLAAATLGTTPLASWLDGVGNDTLRDLAPKVQAFGTQTGLDRPYQFLHLMNGPDESSGVQVLVPGSACNLRATGATQDNWVEVSYRANNGYEYTGWAERWLLTPERGAYNPPAYDAYAQHPDYMSRHRHHAARWPDYSAPQPGYVAPQPDYAAPIYTAPVYQPKPMQQAQTVYSWEHQHDHFYGY